MAESKAEKERYGTARQLSQGYPTEFVWMRKFSGKGALSFSQFGGTSASSILTIARQS